MLDWLRRLIGPAPERGTFTILPDGNFVIGAPGGATKEDIDNMMKDINRWQDYPDKPLVLSWPMDVRDMRLKK